MQVILDSSFARPGSAPIWGGKKGEFRDWTTHHRIKKTSTPQHRKSPCPPPRRKANPQLRWSVCDRHVATSHYCRHCAGLVTGFRRVKKARGGNT